MTKDLEALRRSIDAIDAKLVTLLNERARIVAEVGAVKRATGTPIYAPHREAEVLERALSRNEGPLPDRVIEGVFRELMSGSFGLQRPLRVGYLGPPGTFSHVAAVAHFGSSVELDDLPDIRSVFDDVKRSRVDYGIVPIENSTIGGVADTLDAFTDPGEIHVYAEILVEIRHFLLGRTNPDRIRRIHSRPEVFAQCRNWLRTHFPDAEQILAPSTSQAVKLALEDEESAAVGSELAGRLHGLGFLFEDIQDHPNNVTRFLVLARDRARPSGDDKTSLMFTTPNQPGALALVLNAFHSCGVNLTHIDKRPTGRESFTYTFFVDAVGHYEDEGMQRAIEKSRHAGQSVTVLGSYPRASRVL